MTVKSLHFEPGTNCGFSTGPARSLLSFELAKDLLVGRFIELMDTIKLLLAHADRRVTNLVEVAVLDVCYDQAAVQSIRTSSMDEFVRQGSLCDFDLIVVGAENLFTDRAQKTWARVDEVVKGIQTIRSQNSAPIIAIVPNAKSHEELLEAGVHRVLGFPFNAERLKSDVRPLLDLNGVVEAESNRWSTFGSLFKGFQKARAAS